MWIFAVLSLTLKRSSNVLVGCVGGRLQMATSAYRRLKDVRRHGKMMPAQGLFHAKSTGWPQALCKLCGEIGIAGTTPTCLSDNLVRHHFVGLTPSPLPASSSTEFKEQFYLLAFVVLRWRQKTASRAGEVIKAGRSSVGGSEWNVFWWGFSVAPAEAESDMVWLCCRYPGTVQVRNNATAVNCSLNWFLCALLIVCRCLTPILTEKKTKKSNRNLKTDVDT